MILNKLKDVFDLLTCSLTRGGVSSPERKKRRWDKREGNLPKSTWGQFWYRTNLVQPTGGGGKEYIVEEKGKKRRGRSKVAPK